MGCPPPLPHRAASLPAREEPCGSSAGSRPAARHAIRRLTAGPRPLLPAGLLAAWGRARGCSVGWRVQRRKQHSGAGRRCGCGGGWHRASGSHRAGRTATRPRGLGRSGRRQKRRGRGGAGGRRAEWRRGRNRRRRPLGLGWGAGGEGRGSAGAAREERRRRDGGGGGRGRWDGREGGSRGAILRDACPLTLRAGEGGRKHHRTLAAAHQLKTTTISKASCAGTRIRRHQAQAASTHQLPTVSMSRTTFLRVRRKENQAM